MHTNMYFLSHFFGEKSYHLLIDHSCWSEKHFQVQRGFSAGRGGWNV